MQFTQQLTYTINLQFFPNAGAVGFDRMLTDVEFGCNLPVGFSFGNHTADFFFSAGKQRKLFRCGLCITLVPFDIGRKISAVTNAERMQRLLQHFFTGGFEEIAIAFKTSGPQIKFGRLVHR